MKKKFHFYIESVMFFLNYINVIMKEILIIINYYFIKLEALKFIFL